MSEKVELKVVEKRMRKVLQDWGETAYDDDLWDTHGLEVISDFFWAAGVRPTVEASPFGWLRKLWVKFKRWVW